MTVVCIFDMDNTLCLTSQADERALRHTFSDYADKLAACNLNYDRDIRGKDIGVVCSIVNSRANLNLDPDAVRTQFRAEFHRNIQLVEYTPGTAQALDVLSRSGAGLALASNSSMIRINQVVQRLDSLGEVQKKLSEIMSVGFFSALDQTPNRIKPCPDIFIVSAESAIKQYGDSDLAIYFVEESGTGMKAAVDARNILQEKYGGRINVEAVGYVGDRLMLGQSHLDAEAQLLGLGANRCFQDMMAFALSVTASDNRDSPPLRRVASLDFVYGK